MDKVFGYLQKLLPIVGFYPEWAQWLFMLCLGGILISAFIGIVFYPTAIKAKAGYVADGTLPALTAAARKYNCKYVIESATMIIRINASSSDPQKKKVDDVRIIYTLFALDDVSIFDEGYHTMQVNSTVRRILGSDTEPALNVEPSPTAPSWNIGISLKRGERYTITTGAEYTQLSPFPTTFSMHDFHGLTQNQSAWCYPNHEDVIGQFTMIVESIAAIKRPEVGDMLTVDQNNPNKPNIAEELPELHEPGNGDASYYVLVGKWKNVMPMQYCEMRLTR